MNAAPAEPVLRLDADHKYFLGHERLWGVSEVLADNRLVTDRWYDAVSRSRGIAVHAVLAGVARGLSFSWLELDEDLHGYVESGLRWFDYAKARVIAVEAMRWHPVYRYAGTLDLQVEWRDYEWVWDWKTGKAPKAVRFQMGAYDALLGAAPNGLPRRRAALELQEDGTRANPVFYNETKHFHDANRFLSYLNTSRDRVEFGPKGE